ncbi:MAG: heparan-alpha-glucosaminide N-acetyltransferase domain-containing protein [Deltaproteobacteria bacterium]|nr:heparan-alpha-glucosaminide N-acetyltransferase domain-containing protein [Deltaproteobacteria bacterium]
MGEKQLKFLEFVPLILYITFVRAVGGDAAALPWKISFVTGGIASVVVFTVLMRNKGFILNRIVLGVNLFLISGGIAVALRLDPLLKLYWRFNPAPMFIWIFGVGLAATFLSPSGFTGESLSDRGTVRRHSALLTAATAIALGISLAFRGKAIYADILPFIGLFIVNDRLRAKPSRSPDQG